MRRPFVLVPLLSAAIYAFAASWAAAAQNAATSPQVPTSDDQPATSQPVPLGTLKICLRLQDTTPFLGAASVRVLPEHGDELIGAFDEAKGDVLFYAVPPGKYSVEVGAPAFLTLRLQTEMPGGGEKAVFMVMKPRGAAQATALAPEPENAPEIKSTLNLTPDIEPMVPLLAATAAEPATAPSEKWRPAEWNDDGIAVDRSVACPLEQVLHSAGERVKEFIGSLEKFSATENVQHFTVTKSGERRSPELRKFSYIVVVGHGPRNTFTLEEFRNGVTDTTQFPANIATMGLPAIVLVFHPDYVRDFSYSCDGLAHVGERDYWQVRFAQRLDRPVRIESYVVNGSSHSVYLEGRAWIDPGRGQVVRLESQLEKPIPEIELWQQHQIIDYTGVKFASTGQEVWLPKAAEVYVERHGKKYYRRHTFEDFRLFNVDLAQNVKTPKGSYSFTNLTDGDLIGELTVTPVEGMSGGPIELRFAVPAHRTVVKTVGPGKDVNLQPSAVASAKFIYSGDTGSVRVDVDLVKETTLDIIPEKALANP